VIRASRGKTNSAREEINRTGESDGKRTTKNAKDTKARSSQPRLSFSSLSRFSWFVHSGILTRLRVIGCIMRTQINLATLLLFAAALPMWLYVAIAVTSSPGFGGSSLRYVAAPLALLGITVAVHRLICGNQYAWGLSTIIAPLITWGTLLAATWLVW
jgi:hypothetical protein